MSEDVPPYIPEFYSEAWFDIPGTRGRAVRCQLDRTRNQEEMDELARSVVIVDGARYQCTGVERFCHWSPHYQGETIALRVLPIQ